MVRKLLKAVHYHQTDSLDCGPTCLLIVAEMLGCRVSRSEVDAACGHEKGASSLLQISYAAEKLGMTSRATRYPVAALDEETPLPFLAWWQGSHFLVVYRMKGDFVWVSDPAAARPFRLRKEAFFAGWAREDDAGLAMFFAFPQTSDVIEKRSRSKKNEWRWTEHIRFLRPSLVQLSLLTFSALALGLAVPFISKNLIDSGFGRSDRSLIIGLLIVQALLGIALAVIDALRRYVTMAVGLQAYFLLVARFLAQLLSLPLRFFERRPLGDILGRLEDHRRLENFLSTQAVEFVFGVSYLALMLIVTFAISPPSGMIALVGAIVHLSWTLAFVRWRAVFDYQRFQRDAAIRGLEVRTLEAIADVKVFALESRRRWAWQEAQDQLNDSALAIGRLDQVQDAGARIIHILTSLCALIAIAWSTVEGHSSIGSFVAVSLLMSQLALPMGQMASFARNLQDVRLSSERIDIVYDQRDGELIETVPPSRELTAPAGVRVDLEDIRFSYGAREACSILDGISLSVSAGEVLALVGESGSGKSTLTKLLLRLYEDYDGVIQIDGTPLAALNLMEWRRRCGVVTQDSELFDGTVSENIACGFDAIDFSRVRELSQDLGAEDFIRRLPGGYSAQIGRDGVTISAGQKQRLLIARALYSQPDLLVLDEATSALDAESEHTVVQAIAKHAGKATQIVVAHRLSTIVNASKIAVIAAGKVIETGNHDSLVDLQGAYSRLLRRQIGGMTQS